LTQIQITRLMFVAVVLVLIAALGGGWAWDNFGGGFLH
jgi:hypothetical protein